MTLIALYIAQDGKCFLCGKRMANGTSRPEYFPRGWTREHVIPKSLGGKGGKNIVLSHYKCNSKRGNVMPTEIQIRKAREIHEKAKKVEMRQVLAQS